MLVSEGCGFTFIIPLSTLLLCMHHPSSIDSSSNTTLSDPCFSTAGNLRKSEHFRLGGRADSCQYIPLPVLVSHRDLLTKGVKMIPMSAVVAVTPSWGIGESGQLPWGDLLPKDMAYFRKITTSTTDRKKQNAVIMGRKTWLGIPEKNRPLKKRANIVLTSDSEWATANLPTGVFSAKTLEEAMALLSSESSLVGKIETAMVIGGLQLFEESVLHPDCDTYHLTKIDTEFLCDTILTAKTVEKLKSLKPIEESEIFEENGITYR